ncbi:MAG: 3-carboxy-cis,cis-muconate cycloisomerase, partial [Pseudonocardia sp.]|nr:3-carboxy-cis,cis-muconate cycloisomerase [Pseudonocardia sp.]
MPPESDQGLLAPVWAGGLAEAHTADAALVRTLLDTEAALSRALVAAGLAPARSAEVTTRVAADINPDPRELALAARSGGNPVIPLVRELRTAVSTVDEDAASWVHRGATSQDILDTALMTASARVLDDAVLPALATAADAAAGLAVAHRSTVLAGRTLTQHAVP